MYVCSECKSRDVYYDAYVSANYDGDVLVFDSGYCRDCDGETSIIEESE